MKVILLTEVKNLGRKGEVKEVADGYGLNYLLPKKLAAPASAQTVTKLEEEALAVRMRAERDLRQVQVLAGKLDGVEVDLVGKANPEGKLYAAITPAVIANYLAKQGYAVEKYQVALGSPLKEVGEHKVNIKLRHGLEAEILIHIKTL